MEGREPSYTVGGNPTWYSHYGEQCGDKTGGKKKTLKKLEKKTCHMTQQSRCWAYTWRKPELKETLFTIARTRKQPRCPSADKWIRKLWYIYTMEYYSAIKRNTFESVLMRWMKLEPITQTEVSQKEKHQYSILMHIYGI